ncbi:MAG: AsmA family protein, partial [Burkholderiales bacterium]
MRLRNLLIAIAALLGLAAIAAMVFVATFDANRYKPEVIELVRERTGRVLTIDGELSLALWPRVGLSVGPARLSGPGGRGEFAQFDSARIGVALWPLLARRVVTDRIMIDGLKLEVVRQRDGSTSLDDLLRDDGARAGTARSTPDAGPADAAGAAAAAITIAGVQLRNANVGWRDEAAGTEWRLQQAEFETGRLASGRRDSARLSGRLIANRPLVDVTVELATDYTVDFATLATQLADLDLRVRGRTPAAPQLDARLRGSVSADPANGRFDLTDLKLVARSGDGIEANLDAPALAIAEGSASGKPISGSVRVVRDAQRVDAKLSVAAPTRDKGRIVFGEVKADVTVAGPQLPAGGAKLSLAGDGSVDPGRETATLALHGSADGSALQARVSATAFTPLALRYELQADRLDLDRYRTTSPATGASGTGGSEASATGAAGAPAPAPGAQAGAIPVPPIADLDTSGTLRVGALKVAGIAASNVTATIHSGQGRVELTRLDAGIWRGQLDASARLGEQGRHALRASLKGVDAGMALREMAGRDLLDGRGDLRVDVTGTGHTITALKRSLGGTAAVSLRDGALKGVDLAEVLRKVRQ